MLTFVHIGKTGGSYLKSRLREASAEGPTTILTPRGHGMTLPKAVADNPGTGVLFAVRDPYELFISAFNSRQRKGQPRRYKEHSPAEAEAFARFHSPDELAVALGSLRRGVREEAAGAMRAISHLRRGYSQYLKDIPTLERHAEDISFIFQTETLDDDLQEFARRMEIPVHVPEAVSLLEKHAAPGDQSATLSTRGRLALRHHWGQEFGLYEWSRQYRDQILSEPPRQRGLGT